MNILAHGIFGFLLHADLYATTTVDHLQIKWCLYKHCKNLFESNSMVL